MLTLQETIRPSADLRNHYSEMSKLCKENKEAVIITVNGRGDTVTLSYEEYKNMKARIGIRKIVLYIAQNFGNTIALEKLDEIENEFSNWEKIHTLEPSQDILSLRDRAIKCLF